VKSPALVCPRIKNRRNADGVELIGCSLRQNILRSFPGQELLHVEMSALWHGRTAQKPHVLSHRPHMFRVIGEYFCSRSHLSKRL